MLVYVPPGAVSPNPRCPLPDRLWDAIIVGGVGISPPSEA